MALSGTREHAAPRLSENTTRTTLSARQHVTTWLTPSTQLPQDKPLQMPFYSIFFFILELNYKLIYLKPA